jgi:hypothetical protein
LFSAPDARVTFSCVAKKKVTKKKATPLRRFVRDEAANELPCAAHRAGRLRNSPSLREDSDSPRRIPRPGCAARRCRGEEKHTDRSLTRYRIGICKNSALGTDAQHGRRAGLAFSLATFFWRSKRKYARASGAETSGQSNRSDKRTQKH